MLIRALPLALGVACGVLVAACAKDPSHEDRAVVVNTLRACPLAKSQAFAVIYGSGDFDPLETKPAFASFFLRDDGSVFGDLPAATRALLVDVSQSGAAWRGVTDVPAAGQVDVLLWPNDESCAFTRRLESRNDALQRDVTLSVFGHHLMVVGGLQTTDGIAPYTYVGDLATGTLEQTDEGLAFLRSFATVTPFSLTPGAEPTAALVAGGQDPESQDPTDPFEPPPTKSLRVATTAEIYVPKATSPNGTGTFLRDPDQIQLLVPRTQHGATVLSDGRTFLVGGRGSDGSVLKQLEIIDPLTRTSDRVGLRSLLTPRANPSVLRLANGEVLVFGGVDDGGHRLGSFEWFDRVGQPLARTTPALAAGRENAIIPLAAGGALVVIAPAAGTASDFKTVWVVSPDGSPDPAIPIDPRLLQVVRLFRGAHGAPVIWTGARPDGAGWLRWDPWFGAFQPIPDAPNDGPTSTAIASGDDGLALWLDDRGPNAGMYATGYRFDAQTKYAEVPPLLVNDTIGLAPDRLASPGGAITFDPTLGLLVGPGASAFVTDLTFADFSADVDVTQAAPELVLRQENGIELAIGGARCAFGQNAKKTLHVERKQKQVTVRADDGPDLACEANGVPTELDEGVRVSFGIRGSSGANVSGAKNLRITRR